MSKVKEAPAKPLAPQTPQVAKSVAEPVTTQRQPFDQKIQAASDHLDVFIDGFKDSLDNVISSKSLQDLKKLEEDFTDHTKIYIDVLSKLDNSIKQSTSIKTKIDIMDQLIKEINTAISDKKKQFAQAQKPAATPTTVQPQPQSQPQVSVQQPQELLSALISKYINKDYTYAELDALAAKFGYENANFQTFAENAMRGRLNFDTVKDIALKAANTDNSLIGYCMLKAYLTAAKNNWGPPDYDKIFDIIAEQVKYCLNQAFYGIRLVHKLQEVDSTTASQPAQQQSEISKSAQTQPQQKPFTQDIQATSDQIDAFIIGFRNGLDDVRNSKSLRELNALEQDFTKYNQMYINDVLSKLDNSIKTSTLIKPKINTMDQLTKEVNAIISDKKKQFAQAQKPATTTAQPQKEPLDYLVLKYMNKDYTYGELDALAAKIGYKGESFQEFAKFSMNQIQQSSDSSIVKQKAAQAATSKDPLIGYCFLKALLTAAKEAWGDESPKYYAILPIIAEQIEYCLQRPLEGGKPLVYKIQELESKK